MKRAYWCAPALFLCAPAVAVAAVPGQWAGPYFGVKAGLSQSSGAGFSSEIGFTAGLVAGYDWRFSRHLVVGGDATYFWNQDVGHTACIAGVCGNVNAGSNVMAVDGRVGFPLGRTQRFMPFVKIGYGHLELTGKIDGDDGAFRYGGGLEWRFGYNTSLVFQYMHADYGGGVANWSNDNFIVALNFRF